MNGLIGWGALYLLGLGTIGWWSGRRTKNAADYFAAGRTLGVRVAAWTAMSASLSGFVFVGGPGLTYRIGLQSWFIILPVGWTAALLMLRVGRPLRELARRDDVLTLPDALAARFGGGMVRGVSALWLAIGCLAYAGVQLRALGLLANGWFPGLSVERGIFLGALLVAAYAAIGGMKAAVWTDVWQGIWMVLAAVMVGGAALLAWSGLDGSFTAVAADPQFGESFFRPLAGDGLFLALGYALLFGIGVIGQPQTTGKFLMIDAGADLRRFPLWFAGSQIVCLTVWFGVGLVIPARVAAGRLEPLLDPDTAMSVFLADSIPPLLGDFVLVAVICAVMSTIDSFLNIGAAALTRDLPQAFGRRPGRSLFAPRLASVVLIVLAANVALHETGALARFGTAAFGVFAAAFAPTFALALRWPAVNATVVVIAMTVGGGSSLVLEALRRMPDLWGSLPAGVTRLPPSATALLLGFLVLGLGGLFRARRKF